MQGDYENKGVGVGENKTPTPKPKKTISVQQYEVVKSYCGIAEGEIITPARGTDIEHMVNSGYWKAI